MKISLQNIGSIKELHELLNKHLGFPEFYGNSWDAFWDTITGLVKMPTVLTLTGWSQFASRFPTDAEILEEIVTEYNAANSEQIELE